MLSGPLPSEIVKIHSSVRQYTAGRLRVELGREVLQTWADTWGFGAGRPSILPVLYALRTSVSYMPCTHAFSAAQQLTAKQVLWYLSMSTADTHSCLQISWVFMRWKTYIYLYSFLS